MAPLKVFWQPNGTTFDSIGSKRYVRHSDGDTPTISTAIRMLSIDTPELHYPENSKPSKHDGKLADLAGWLQGGRSPADPDLAAYLAQRLAGGDAGTRQEQQGHQASDAFQSLLDSRLKRADGTLRPIFVRTADRPFDDYGRLLAYIAPQYSPAELRTKTLEDRATFNLLMVEAGWAAPFLIFPDLPGQPDLKLFHQAADTAVTGGRGIWGDPFVLTGYEFRMAYQLWEVTAKLVRGEAVASSERTGWVTRWCADMTTGLLYEPQAYFRVRPQDRLFLWPQDVREAVASLNLTPA